MSRLPDSYNVTDLLERGWTRSLIDRLLGSPDRYRGWAYYYEAVRVNTVEASPEYIAARAAIERRRKPETNHVDLLAAIFAVNRSAKRYRDAAQGQFVHRQHGFARCASAEKEYLYGLKDRGIAAAHSRGRLEFHGFHARLAIYRGEGYCFHSTLLPRDAVQIELPNQDKFMFLESKPREATESRLCDAVATLVELPDQTTGFTRIETPRFTQGKRVFRRAGEPSDDPNGAVDSEWDE